MSKKELLAYTAGLIDGEGYIGLVPNYGWHKTSFCPKVKVASTSFELVEFLHKNFGGHLDKPRFTNQKNRKPAKMWTLSNMKHVKPFLEGIRPYLVVKRKHADLIIDYIEKCFRFRKGKGELRKSYYLQMRKLNHRGLPLATTE